MRRGIRRGAGGPARRIPAATSTTRPAASVVVSVAVVLSLAASSSSSSSSTAVAAAAAAAAASRGTSPPSPLRPSRLCGRAFFPRRSLRLLQEPTDEDDELGGILPSLMPSPAAGAERRVVTSRSGISGIILKDLRGGSTKVAAADSPSPSSPSPPSSSEGASSPAAATAEATAVEVHTYRLKQQLHLQSRSLQLRNELIRRGLDGLSHGESSQSQQQPKLVDWDCALSTEKNPKSCLYSFDAEVGSKVIAPIDTQQYITLSALNRLRRQDPTKVEPLWHSQYAVLKGWMSPDSPYSLYTHLGLLGTCLSCLLDAPIILASTMVAAIVVAVLATLPVWESAIQLLLTSRSLWMQWPNWARFVHAAFPLKLLLGQMAWKFLASAFDQVYQQIRRQLVELECQIYQKNIPLTVIENGDGIAPDEEGIGSAGGGGAAAAGGDDEYDDGAYGGEQEDEDDEDRYQQQGGDDESEEVDDWDGDEYDEDEY